MSCSFEKMNRRTVEQGTAEYRSEKRFLSLSKTSAVSAGGGFDIRHSIYKNELGLSEDEPQNKDE
jgi:hypothetical protein